MAGFNQVLVDGAHAVVRAVEHHARQAPETSTTDAPSPTPTSPTSSLGTALSSALASITSNTLTSQATDSQPPDPSGTNDPQQGSGDGTGGGNPLLFFVALGFGVVFTNLW